jgi:protease I
VKALILTADGFEDRELYYPYYRLLEEGFEVDVAAPKRGEVTGKHGYAFEANLGFADVQPDGYDLLVLPGGKGPETVRLDERAVEATRRIFDAGKPVAAICHGAQVLISAGVLQNKKATCWQGIRDDLKAALARYADEEVVVDDNLITSRCPDDLPAFCRELLAAVRGEESKCQVCT